MNHRNTLTAAPSSYSFLFGSAKGEQRATITIEADTLTTDCTCGNNKQHHPCWHVQYVLAGKTSRITGGDTNKQKQAIENAAQTLNGKKIVRRAKKRFEHESHCRRCNSERIVKIKYSLMARLFTMFKDVHHHTYFCKECKWTW